MGHTGGEEAENDRSMDGGAGRGSESGSAGGSGKGVDTSSGEEKMASGSGKPVDYENFWEAPEFTWRHPDLSEREVDAVMVSFVGYFGVSSCCHTALDPTTGGARPWGD